MFADRVNGVLLHIVTYLFTAFDNMTVELLQRYLPMKKTLISKVVITDLPFFPL